MATKWYTSANDAQVVVNDSFTKVTNKYAEVFKAKGGEIFLNTKVFKIRSNGTKEVIETTQGSFDTKLVVNTAGLYSDKVATLNHEDIDTRIIPFRG